MISIVEWNSWKRNNNVNVETWLGFPMTQDWNCSVRVCKALLLLMNLKQWAPKRRLSTILVGFNNELKGKVNATYLFLGNDGEIAMDDIDIAKIFNDLLESLIKGAKYIMRKEVLGPEMLEKQHDFFQKSSELEDIPIMILSGQLDLDAGKRACNSASAAIET